MHSPFVFRDRGSMRLWQIVEDGYTGLHDPKTTNSKNPKYRELTPGETIYFCVWKNGNLDVRKSYTLKPGDVQFVDSGDKRIDFSKPATRERGYATTDEPIMVNEFGGKCPAWLKSVRPMGTSQSAASLRDSASFERDTLALMRMLMKGTR